MLAWEGVLLPMSMNRFVLYSWLKMTSDCLRMSSEPNLEGRYEETCWK
jgi:hypothetical protein